MGESFHLENEHNKKAAILRMTNDVMNSVIRITGIESGEYGGHRRRRAGEKSIRAEGSISIYDL
jgi:hypothetical protein